MVGNMRAHPSTGPAPLFLFAGLGVLFGACGNPQVDPTEAGAVVTIHNDSDRTVVLSACQDPSCRTVSDTPVGVMEPGQSASANVSTEDLPSYFATTSQRGSWKRCMVFKLPMDTPEGSSHSVALSHVAVVCSR